MGGGNNTSNVGGDNEDEDENLDGVTRMRASQIRAKYKYFITSQYCNKNDNNNDDDNDDSFCWSEKRSVLENITLLIGNNNNKSKTKIRLPTPESTERSDFVAECGICYAHRLPLDDNDGNEGVAEEREEKDKTNDDEPSSSIPSVTCPTSSCSRVYHEGCLFEWLYSLSRVMKIAIQRAW